jgi:hypothetical protein
VTSGRWGAVLALVVVLVVGCGPRLPNYDPWPRYDPWSVPYSAPPAVLR